MTRLRDAGNREDNNKRRVGLVDYLSLSPSDQHARYLSNLQRDSEADPGNARLKLNLARELIAQGKRNEGVDVLRQLAATDLERNFTRGLREDFARRRAICGGACGAEPCHAETGVALFADPRPGDCEFSVG